MRYSRASALALALVLLAACGDSDSYLARRARFQTHLLVRGRAHTFDGDTVIPHLSLDAWQPWENCHLDSVPLPRLTGSLDSVTYRSGDVELPAWLYTPSGPSGQRLPALLYLHPVWGLTAANAACATPFMAAGLVVMWPTYRGENGNPGVHEALLGEVDDAVMAARWLAAQPQVDPRRVYAFGWSAGGGIATLLSLMDVPLRHSGSSGGIYGSNLSQWEPPYDTTIAAEWQIRSLAANLRWMRHPHYAYVEQADDGFWMASLLLIQQATPAERRLLRLTMLPGDHLTVYPEAARRYLNEILADGGGR